MAVCDKIDFEAWKNKEYICPECNTAQSYFMFGWADLCWNFADTPNGSEIYTFSNRKWLLTASRLSGKILKVIIIVQYS